MSSLLKDAFAGLPVTHERWVITRVLSVEPDGKPVVELEQLRGLGIGWEVLPKRRIGPKGVEGLKGKEVIFNVQTNAVGTKLKEMVSVRKPRA